jgi:hypothetical protein
MRYFMTKPKQNPTPRGGKRAGAGVKPGTVNTPKIGSNVLPQTRVDDATLTALTSLAGRRGVKIPTLLREFLSCAEGLAALEGFVNSTAPVGLGPKMTAENDVSIADMQIGG